jgi:hypothetical protein
MGDRHKRTKNKNWRYEPEEALRDQSASGNAALAAEISAANAATATQIKDAWLDSGSVHDLSRGKGDTLVTDSAALGDNAPVVIALKEGKAPTAERLEEWRVFAQKCCDTVEDRVRHATVLACHSACRPAAAMPCCRAAMLWSLRQSGDVLLRGRTASDMILDVTPDLTCPPPPSPHSRRPASRRRSTSASARS